MAALAESGLHNLGGTAFAGYFGMHGPSTRATTAASRAIRTSS